MANPTLPPSLGGEFRELRERLDTLERGDRSLTYRQALTTNDASNARDLFMGRQGPGSYVPRDWEIYAAALVNPRYPVLVARLHLTVIGGGSACEIYFRSAMGPASRTTRRWTLAPTEGFDTYTAEVAWLHGMPVDEWSDTIDQSRIKRGNVEIHINVTAQRPIFDRNEDFAQDARDKGFTDDQIEFMNAWFPTTSAFYPVYAREPEYVFLAPLSAFPTATPEGTLLTGSTLPGYPVTPADAPAGRHTASGPEPHIWPNTPGEWPIPARDFGYGGH